MKPPAAALNPPAAMAPPAEVEQSESNAASAVDNAESENEKTLAERDRGTERSARSR
jgi:hypothetical protein